MAKVIDLVDIKQRAQRTFALIHEFLTAMEETPELVEKFIETLTPAEKMVLYDHIKWFQSILEEGGD